MKIIVNGEMLEVSATTLATVLDELQYNGNWLATAVNGEVVRAPAREACALRDNDLIEILSPMQGG